MEITESGNDTRGKAVSTRRKLHKIKNQGGEITSSISLRPFLLYTNINHCKEI